MIPSHAKETLVAGSNGRFLVRVDPLARLDLARGRALDAGGPARVERHRAGGRRLTARERLDYLLDPGSFAETGMHVLPQSTSRQLPVEPFPGDGVVTGFGRIDGREIAVIAQDFTVLGGSLGAAAARKICALMDQAAETRVPLVQICDSGGARIQEGVSSLAGYGDIMMRNVRLSGVVPQISVVMGPCAGGAVYSPALTDFVVMTRESSHMFVTGPDVIRTVTGEETTLEELGGADAQARAGVAHLVAETERDALDHVRDLLSYLPSARDEAPPNAAPAPVGPVAELDAIIPDDPKAPYDVREVVARLADHGRYLETQPGYAANLVTAFARIDGRAVGILANQPRHLAGVLDRAASEKGARFVRCCDSFNVPLVSIVDVPGFMPGLAEEHGGIIRRGAKLLYAYCEATVPKLTVITRKAYGGAYIVMCSKHLGSDVNLAWPQAEIAVLGAEAAVTILHRKELAGAADADARRAVIEDDYRERFGNPYQAAELGYVDDVIAPSETRVALARHLARLATKRSAPIPRKHGNMPT